MQRIFNKNGPTFLKTVYKSNLFGKLLNYDTILNQNIKSIYHINSLNNNAFRSFSDSQDDPNNNNKGDSKKIPRSKSKKNKHEDKQNEVKQNEDKQNEDKQSEISGAAAQKDKINPENTNFTTADGSPNTDSSEPNKKTIPLKSMKLTLDPEDMKSKQKSYVLFSSSHPIIPYTEQNGIVRTGNLASNHISNELAYFLQNDAGEIYPIGVILKNEINKKLKSEMDMENKFKNKSSVIDGLGTPNSIKAIITTKAKNFRIKLTEIELKDNCMFAKGITYRDRPLTKDEKSLNIADEIQALKNVLNKIKYLRQLSHNEEPEIFSKISLDRFTIKDAKYDINELDEQLYKIVDDMLKLSKDTQEKIYPFVQTFIEQRTIFARLFLIKRKLEDTIKILDIVNKNIKAADEYIYKLHEGSKARLAIDYIKSIYLSNSMPGSGINSSALGGGGGATTSSQTLNSAARKFMEKLLVIKDEISREKVKKEIERFGILDKNSSEYHKLHTYLDEVFSIPWNTYTNEVWDVEFSKQVLDDNIYGLDKVKERIIELIAVNRLKLAQEGAVKKGFVILLYGPPGTGKTSMAKTIATALKRESRFISFAGVSDPHFMKGHRRTYVDSQPGELIFIESDLW